MKNFSVRLFMQVCVCLALVCAALPVSAREHILNFHADILVQADGTLDVTETIEVHAEGKNIRRGIYRDFPTRYRNRHGDQVVVDFEVVGVERDGKVEPWFTEALANGIRINTGNDNFLPTPLTTSYRIHYRTSRQLGFFENHDELYWNVTGTGWIFDMASASARVQLPEAIPEAQLQLDYYTGAQGSRAKNALAKVTDAGVIDFATTSALAEREGLTIVVGFPKGIVTAPTTAQQFTWFLNDNRAHLLLLVGLLAVFWYYLHYWRRHGRDPHAGPIFAHYYPPENFSPGSLRYMTRAGYDDRCFAADVVHMSVKGLIAIHRDKKLFSDKWRLEKLREQQDTELTTSEQQLFSHLFAGGGSEIALEQENYEILGRAKSKHSAALVKLIKPRYFVDNTAITVKGWLLSAGFVVVAFLLAESTASLTFWALLVIMLVTNVVFGILMRRPTKEGRQLLDHIAGLKLYMKVASKDELASLKHHNADDPPPLNAEQFESLLPFALALDVEEAWTKQFTKAVGVTEANRATDNMHWYHGAIGGSGLASLSKDLGRSLSSQISSSSTPPGSSSGGGGGGSSGGGGGGGGGGGR